MHSPSFGSRQGTSLIIFMNTWRSVHRKEERIPRSHCKYRPIERKEEYLAYHSIPVPSLDHNYGKKGSMLRRALHDSFTCVQNLTKPLHSVIAPNSHVSGF